MTSYQADFDLGNGTTASVAPRNVGEARLQFRNADGVLLDVVLPHAATLQLLVGPAGNDESKELVKSLQAAADPSTDH